MRTKHTVRGSKSASAVSKRRLFGGRSRIFPLLLSQARLPIKISKNTKRKNNLKKGPCKPHSTTRLRG